MKVNPSQEASQERAYYTVAEAASVLNVSRTTIWRWIDAGRLTAYRVGPRTIRIAREQLDALIGPHRTARRATTLETPQEPADRDIWADYDPAKVKRALRRAAGVLAGIDREALKRDIRTGREQQSRGRPA
ncbi:MAG: helix-turn-helix domain-containing protein [Dehalococcoidia bacterium]